MLVWLKSNLARRRKTNVMKIESSQNIDFFAARWVCWMHSQSHTWEKQCTPTASGRWPDCVYLWACLYVCVWERENMWRQPCKCSQHASRHQVIPADESRPLPNSKHSELNLIKVHYCAVAFIPPSISGWMSVHIYIYPIIKGTFFLSILRNILF